MIRNLSLSVENAEKYNLEINANLQVDISDEIDTIESDEDEATRFLIKEIHFIVNKFFFAFFIDTYIFQKIYAMMELIT